MSFDQPARPLRRGLRRLALAAVAALALAPMVVVASAAPASANTNSFRGFNWAQLGDNYTDGLLVVQGLSSSDSYETVRAKANALYDDMESTVGANTVRLPINTHTVASSWWNSYRGAIDAATDRGFKVILAYWEDGAASGGRITNMAAFNTMWSRVTSRYGSNTRVYFEPMNEPHGYSSSEWRDVAAGWLDYHYSALPERVLIGGTGSSQDLRPICSDSRFDGTLLSIHHYAFFYGERSYWAQRDDFEARLGECGSRAVMTEFGAPMDNGLNYNDSASTSNFVRHIRAVTDEMRQQGMGSVYWPALGGKPTGSSGYDWYSMFAFSGSGTNLNLTLRNQSGADRLRLGWGL
jgi:endoglucanase